MVMLAKSAGHFLSWHAYIARRSSVESDELRSGTRKVTKVKLKGRTGSIPWAMKNGE